MRIKAPRLCQELRLCRRSGLSPGRPSSTLWAHPSSRFPEKWRQDPAQSSSDCCEDGPSMQTSGHPRDVKKKMASWWQEHAGVPRDLGALISNANPMGGLEPLSRRPLSRNRSLQDLAPPTRARPWGRGPRPPALQWLQVPVGNVP
ncbi:uncharacterized protein LOC119524375 isoform X2 [Choloepus didactylus]|uniref:uncharacterized protein LOC119524375 isoform X2 n=1 Tax=Choloepus didactylus TaxID=27675 RepID=UPI00189F453C|nr:uncharacterized protein LOC119524375 isoform X2 [Choloepus didactylus]